MYICIVLVFDPLNSTEVNRGGLNTLISPIRNTGSKRSSDFTLVEWQSLH